jgi:hypothetical protein
MVLKDEKKKGTLINELLKNGIYKLFDKQLYELPIIVLENEYNKLRGC